MEVVVVPQLSDNYAYLVFDSTGDAGVVDCAQAAPVLAVVRERGVRLRAVLATHHHYDHVGGNEDLLAAIPDLRVYGSEGDAPRIPGITDRLRDGDGFTIGQLHGRVIFIPAHTSGHIAYHFPTEAAVFTGDTLFAGGCGRLFEGDAGQMLQSLSRLSSLPENTKVYCGHEYTQKNLQFALQLEPRNGALRRKMASVEALRAAGHPTVPTTIADERATNPFLRTRSEELAESTRRLVPGLPSDDEVALFAAVRSLKDRF